MVKKSQEKGLEFHCSRCGTKRFWRDASTCDVLLMEGGTAVCLIQKYLGFECKPVACREYPGDKPCEADLAGE